SDHWRVEDVGDTYHFRQKRMLVVLRVMGRSDLDPGQLFARSPVLVHVAHRAHGVLIVSGTAIRTFEGGLWRCRKAGVSSATTARSRSWTGVFRPGPASERHQRDGALASRNGFRCVTDVKEVGGTARIGRV